jgi:hypothetical protein
MMTGGWRTTPKMMIEMAKPGLRLALDVGTYLLPASRKPIDTCPAEAKLTGRQQVPVPPSSAS